MIDPIGTLSLRGCCFNIEIYNTGPELLYASMQFQDEHKMIWRLHLGNVKELLDDDSDYFIRLMTTEQLTIRIKVLDPVCEKAYPRSYYCDYIKYE